MYCLCNLFLIVSFIGCGGGNSSENREPPNRSAAISFQLTFAQPPSQHTQTGIDSASSEPDVCIDYGIDTIAVSVYQTQDNTEVASAEGACADHSITVKNVPAGKSLYVVCKGLFGPNTAWQGQCDDVFAIADQNTDIGIIDMQYIGDDTTGPEIISTFPAADATDVDLSAWIVVGFNEALSPSTIPDKAIVVLKSDIPVPGQVSYDPSTRSIRFTPADAYSFDTETTYSVTLQSQGDDNRTITDIAGNPLTGDVSWQFSTRGSDDNTAPQIIATSPPNGAMDVSQQVSISVVFSEPMNSASLTGSILQLSSDQGTIDGQILYDEQTRTLSMIPNFVLNTTTLYTAVISTDAMDLSQNTLPKPYSWQFRTVGPLYNLTVLKSGNGSGFVTSTPSFIECGDTCQAEISANTQITLEATAGDNSEFTGWSGDFCNGDTGPCSIVITDDTTVTANFSQRNSHTISTSVIPEDGSGGSISPANAVVLHGDEQAFEIQSKGGYNTVTVKVDGELITPSSSYKFENVTESHTIEATFKYISVISEKPVSHDSYPQININGHVVWNSDNGSKSDIYYRHSGSEENISEEIPGGHFNPQINANEHIVWECKNSSRTDIYYYYYDYTQDKPIVKNITQDYNLPSGHLPRINDSGHVVWLSKGNGSSEFDVYYYSGSTPFLLPKSSDSVLSSNLTENNVQLINIQPALQINTKGDVVWINIDGITHEIIYYDGTKSINLSQRAGNSGSGLDPQINAEGDVVWSTYVDLDSEIYYYRRSTDETSNLSNNIEGDDKRPQINKNGYVVWECDYGSESDIYFYDGKTIDNLTEHWKGNCKMAQINALGNIVWQASDESYTYLYYKGLVSYKSAYYSNLTPQICDKDEAVWLGYNGHDYDICAVKAEIHFYQDHRTTKLKELPKYHDYFDTMPFP